MMRFFKREKEPVEKKTYDLKQYEIDRLRDEFEFMLNRKGYYTESELEAKKQQLEEAEARLAEGK